MRVVKTILTALVSYVLLWTLCFLIEVFYFAYFVKGKQFPHAPGVYSGAGVGLISGLLVGPVVGIVGTILLMVFRKKYKRAVGLFLLAMLLIDALLILFDSRN